MLNSRHVLSLARSSSCRWNITAAHENVYYANLTIFIMSNVCMKSVGNDAMKLDEYKFQLAEKEKKLSEECRKFLSLSFFYTFLLLFLSVFRHSWEHTLLKLSQFNFPA